MTRRLFASLFLTIVSCSRRPDTVTALPHALPGNWKLVAQETETPEAAPQVLRDLGLRRTTRARYSGPAEIDVTVYELASATVAFEARQKWTPVENTVSSHRDSCFVVVRSTGGRSSAIEFLTEFEKQFSCGPR
jgi:hypothetical protein